MIQNLMMLWIGNHIAFRMMMMVRGTRNFEKESHEEDNLSFTLFPLNLSSLLLSFFVIQMKHPKRNILEKKNFIFC